VSPAAEAEEEHQRLQHARLAHVGEHLYVYTGPVVQWQGSLFALGTPSVAAGARTERVVLDATSWIDVTRGFLDGADELCAELIASVGWRRHRRRMYDRVLDDPRLSCWFTAESDPPHPALAEVRRALSQRYRRPFGGPGLNHYRDGNDSVAFHRDRELRELEDTMVAVLTLGARRRFLVRPHGGGRSIDLAPASGDLLVMGGRCQLDWEHGVPKVASAGARVSVSWRWTNRDGAHTIGPQGEPVPYETTDSSESSR
jgi:alkylated DNA repair dioxygenase AlkB